MKKYIKYIALVIFIICILLVIIIRSEKTKQNNTNEVTNTEKIENELKEINFTTLHEILKSTELKDLRNKLVIEMPKVVVDTPKVYILPDTLNGVKCNTINYEKFFDEYNHTFDGMVSSVSDGTVTINSEIIKKVKDVKVDTGNEIKKVEYMETSNSVAFNMQESGIYIIECEMKNDTIASMVFQVYIHTT